MDIYKIVGKFVLEGKEQFDNDVNDAKEKGNGLASSIGKGLATAAKVGAAAIGVAATAVSALVKSSLDSYAEYEQLVGGSKLLFGDAYSYIADKAKNAYSTVQMSQNEYLQQVNGFATGLKTALNGDVQAAAELADRIITAEADIVAATGNSQEAVQNAFNGIMKSNFTMLDNLQIGITPTKEGFQEVIDKVNEWNKANGNATKYQIDNLADCQSALLDYIEMQGLSGYAQAEAADTIQGSLSMMKASWQNLVSGMADENANVEDLINGFVNSTITAANQVMPTISHALGGIGQLVEGLAPVISTALPGLIDSILPSLINAAVSLVSTVANQLPSILNTSLPIVISAVLSILNALIDVLTENSGQFLQTGLDAIVQIVTGISLSLPKIIKSAVTIVTELIGTLTSPENLQLLLSTAMLLIDEIVTGLMENLPALVEAAIMLVNNLVNFITDPSNLESLLNMALDLVITIVDGLLAAIPQLVTATTELIIQFVNFLYEPDNISMLISSGIAIVGAIAGGLLAAVPDLLIAAFELIEDLDEKFRETDWAAIGKAIIDGLLEGLKTAWSSVSTWFGNAWSSLFNKKVTVTADKNGNVSVNSSSNNGGFTKTAIDGSNASGLDYVPFDGYISELHKGEAVLTATEAAIWRAGKSIREATTSEPQQRTSSHSGITIVQNIQTVPQTPVEFAAATEAYFEQARWSMA